jgi:hypothetical protein
MKYGLQGADLTSSQLQSSLPADSSSISPQKQICFSSISHEKTIETLRFHTAQQLHFSMTHALPQRVAHLRKKETPEKSRLRMSDTVKFREREF